jgi:hypothetical protein
MAAGVRAEASRVSSRPRRKSSTRRRDAGTALQVAGVALWPWVELARRTDLSIDQICDEAGVSVTELRDPDARFNQAAADSVAALLFRHVGGHAALAAALTIEAGHFTLFELLARTAPTVADALAQGCRFFSLIHSEVSLRCDVLPTGDHALHMVSPPTYTFHPGYTELTFAAWMLGIRRETERPDIAPVSVWFRHSAPAEPVDMSLYERVFGPSICFDMPEDRMDFALEVAALPLVRENSEVHAAAIDAAVNIEKD